MLSILYTQIDDIQLLDRQVAITGLLSNWFLHLPISFEPVKSFFDNNGIENNPNLFETGATDISLICDGVMSHQHEDGNEIAVLATESLRVYIF